MTDDTKKGETMTRPEAINELSEMKTDAWTDERQMKALTMAIQSMKAIEKIKAILEDVIGRGEDNVEQ